MKQLLANFLFKFFIRFLPVRKLVNKSGDVGITMLLCHRDIYMVVYCLQSFFYYLGFNLPIYVVDDGSLLDEDRQLLKKYFLVTFDNKTETERKIKKTLVDYPEILDYRFSHETGILKKKLIDATLFNPFIKFILMDADMLFYRKPKEIVDWLNSKDRELLYVSHKYVPEEGFEEDSEIITRRLAYEFFPSKMNVYMCSGLVCFPNKSVMNLKKLDNILKLFKKVDLINRWLVEQHIFPILLGDQKIKELDKQMYINVWLVRQYYSSSFPKKILMHFAGWVKPLFDKEAVKLCWLTNFFRAS